VGKISLYQDEGQDQQNSA